MPGLIHAGEQTRVCAPAACVMAGLRFCVLAVIALLSLSQTVDGQCTSKFVIVQRSGRGSEAFNNVIGAELVVNGAYNVSINYSSFSSCG